MDPKAAAREKIESVRSTLIDLSHQIHANPELGFQETKASAWLSEALSRAGLRVEGGICDLPTAFSAQTGEGPFHIAFCAEYDCLPGIGHACGHNMIAAMSVGAAIGAAHVADELGLTVSVIGTPAEEGGGGKILLLERGAFAGVHAMMMLHPNGYPYDVLDLPINAAQSFTVAYTGKEAHAAGNPELGINAADALTIAQTAIGLLRQHLRATDRVHGIVTKGGDAPNVIPAHTAAKYIVRAQNLEELGELRAKVYRCFEAGALATGSKMEIVEAGKAYAQMVQDAEMLEFYRRNAEALGRKFGEPGRGGVSTDVGNVSLVIPTIQPGIGINSLPAVNHQPEFAAHCVSAEADRAVIEGAVALAWTAVDLATNEKARQRLLPKV